ncbi:MAG: nitrilase-related carbon-nitrogen hydrolase, partial [Thermosulfidibacteraceae bacterium]
AKIIFYPTAIGWLPSEKEDFGKAQYNAWETVQRGHAVANGCYVVAINRVGFEESPDGNEGIEFWGQSFVANPYGEIIKKASVDKEENLICEIDLSIIDNVRTVWPFFRDRRIDSYQDITKRFID